jgi:hypothetical protein
MDRSPSDALRLTTTPSYGQGNAHIQPLIASLPLADPTRWRILEMLLEDDRPTDVAESLRNVFGGDLRGTSAS